MNWQASAFVWLLLLFHFSFGESGRETCAPIPTSFTLPLNYSSELNGLIIASPLLLPSLPSSTLLIDTGHHRTLLPGWASPISRTAKRKEEEPRTTITFGDGDSFRGEECEVEVEVAAGGHKQPVLVEGVCGTFSPSDVHRGYDGIIGLSPASTFLRSLCNGTSAAVNVDCPLPSLPLPSRVCEVVITCRSLPTAERGNAKRRKYWKYPLLAFAVVRRHTFAQTCIERVEVEREWGREDKVWAHFDSGATHILFPPSIPLPPIIHACPSLSPHLLFEAEQGETDFVFRLHIEGGERKKFLSFSLSSLCTGAVPSSWRPGLAMMREEGGAHVRQIRSEGHDGEWQLSSETCAAMAWLWMERSPLLHSSTLVVGCPFFVLSPLSLPLI
uniref:Peptidase A1 domain-containing protein n=1 Tax=Palpitomonas bilix TaxID=652834 RepID=A0A7S3D0K3_9EUKA|mmetsp:Transcript_17277/g.43075  ORF Transcript_17277/g.43075 Transcript_17277/m.43075 type:complete len:386 (+) Transcript_17277:150-1307(+)